MEDIIYINFIGIKNDIELKNNIELNYVCINIINSNCINLFLNNYKILFNIDLSTNQKKYYIFIEKEIITQLNNTNIKINLPEYYYFKYDYYKNEQKKSIIIYKNFNYLPLIYLGLPNRIDDKDFFKIIYEYKKINNVANYFYNCCNCPDCSNCADGTNIYETTLFNNHFGNDNYLTNTLKIQGDIFEICINDGDIIGYNVSDVKTYKLFKIKNNIDVNSNIYFYDDCSGNFISYIIYLNSYNFIHYKNISSDYKNISLDYENITIGINYIDSTGSIYYSILSLNMQTYNPEQFTSIDTSGNYYNVLFFYNYINNTYNIDTINIFSYDYEKYFLNTNVSPELFNINNSQSNLYDIIIETDINISEPIILNILNPFLYMNLDFINLNNKLINPEFANNYFYKITRSNKINLNVLIEYLINFTIKKYNVYKLINSYQIEKNNKTINFNNNVVNCIRCKIFFYYSSDTNIKINGIYSVDAKLFLNNYNLELYHKKYDFDNISTDHRKKKLINMLLFLQSTTCQIKLYFYNKKNSVVPAYYLFNQINLLKNEYKTEIDIDVLNNDYTDGYLKFNIQIYKEYYILFLYAETNTFITNYDELIFKQDTFIFKIFKINEPNGKSKENYDLFYISFQNLKEINIFMNFIKNGILEQNDIILSNYFNIPISKTFYNYYDLNNYWILDDTIGNKYNITFSINELYLNQIYLYGDLFIKTI